MALFSETPAHLLQCKPVFLCGNLHTSLSLCVSALSVFVFLLLYPCLTVCMSVSVSVPLSLSLSLSHTHTHTHTHTHAHTCTHTHFVRENTAYVVTMIFFACFIRILNQYSTAFDWIDLYPKSILGGIKKLPFYTVLCFGCKEKVEGMWKIKLKN